MSSTLKSIEVHLPTLLRAAAEGKTSVRVEATTFGGSIEALLESYPLLRPHLYDDQGALRDHINLFLNDQNIRWLGDWETSLHPGDTVTIVQAVSGG